MTILKPRTRMISIRLSEEEHAALIRVCLATGARSLSDFTRYAMRSLLNGAVHEDALRRLTDEFRSEVRTLGQKIDYLASEISSSKSKTEF